MTRNALALTFALSLGAPAVAAADHPGSETGRDHHELRHDRHDLQDDLRDVERAEALLRAFRDARASRRHRDLEAIEARVQAALDDEVREAERERHEAERELRHDGQEVRRDRSAPRQDAPRDRHDDRGDLQDDRRDVMRESAYLDRVRALRGEWARLRGLRRPWDMDRKQNLLQELVRLSRFEIRADVDETHEDRGELREDQHERR